MNIYKSIEAKKKNKKLVKYFIVMQSYIVDEKCIRLTDNIFIVKNQNGFKKALYELKKPDFEHGENYGDNLNYSKKELRQMVRDYPKTYPAVVAFRFIWEIEKIDVDVLYEKDIQTITNYFKTVKNDC